jgi:hypothetical protein
MLLLATNHFKIVYWCQYKPLQTCSLTSLQIITNMLLTSIQTFTNLFTDFNTYYYKLVYWLHDKPLLTSIQTTTTFVSPLVNLLIVSTNIILWQVKTITHLFDLLLTLFQIITNLFTDCITNHYWPQYKPLQIWLLPWLQAITTLVSPLINLLIVSINVYIIAG